MPHKGRLPFLALGMLALLAGLWGGTLRLGWDWPSPLAALPPAHGPLMVCGFLGTVVGLERAVALRAPWAYAAPLLSGLGGLALIAGVPGPAAPLLIASGSAVLAAASAVLVRDEPTLHAAVMGTGAAAWLAGNLLWLAGWPIPLAAPWWAGFLVLTIAGERLELSRLMRPGPGARGAFLAAAGLYLAGLLAGLAAPGPGARLAGAGALALALWLLRHDLARRSLRAGGLPRFTAVCLLAGYLWLAAAGALGLAHGAVAGGPLYDAALHAVFVGFAFSMIFGHAPIVFPALLGRPMAFRRGFYLHLALLHLSLALRVAGDLGPWWPGRLWGGLGNGAAVALFLAATAAALRAGEKG